MSLLQLAAFTKRLLSNQINQKFYKLPITSKTGFDLFVSCVGFTSYFICTIYFSSTCINQTTTLLSFTFVYEHFIIVMADYLRLKLNLTTANLTTITTTHHTAILSMSHIHTIQNITYNNRN